MRTCAVICSLLIVASALGQTPQPKEPRVPDSATAVRKAEAALILVYGKRQVESERPFTALLKNDVWTVSGTLHCPGNKDSTLCDGGVAVVQISKKDGRILSMIHYK